jgi:hypothetical protein
MVPLARGAYYAWLRVLGWCLLAAGLIFFGFYFLSSLSSSYTATVLARMSFCLATAELCTAAAVIACILKIFLSKRYDPNNHAELPRRMQMAKTMTISKERLEEMMQEKQSQA